MPSYVSANSLNQRPRIGARYADPWTNRFSQQDPFTTPNTVADNGGWMPPQVQRSPDHEAIRNKAYADAIKFHDSNHQRIYTAPPVEQVPSQSLIDSMTPKTPAPAPATQEPVQQAQTQMPTTGPSQLPRFSDGTPYTPGRNDAYGSALYKDSNPDDPMAQYVQGRAFSMQYNALGGTPQTAAPQQAQQAQQVYSAPRTYQGRLPVDGIPLGDSGIIGGPGRMPSEPLMGVTNVDPWANYLGHNMGRF